jgi:hypothetical protein
MKTLNYATQFFQNHPKLYLVILLSILILIVVQTVFSYIMYKWANENTTYILLDQLKKAEEQTQQDIKKIGNTRYLHYINLADVLKTFYAIYENKTLTNITFHKNGGFRLAWNDREQLKDLVQHGFTEYSKDFVLAMKKAELCAKSNIIKEENIKHVMDKFPIESEVVKIENRKTSNTPTQSIL